jgi:hypothetical protein
MYADAVFHEQPDWSRRPGRRLALNFLPSTLIVAGALMVLRLPVFDLPMPLTVLVVRILTNEVEEAASTPPEEQTAVEPAPATPGKEATLVEEPAASEARPQTDWYALVPEAARAAIEAAPREYSINPGFDEKRRQAAEQFAPSQAPVKRPIWENVEKDVMGRTLLRSGDCYKVLDDPNVGNRDAFLTFGQFMVTCERPSDRPRELPWVSELQNRREGQVRYGHPAAE